MVAYTCLSVLITCYDYKYYGDSLTLQLYFATSNSHKFDEVASYLARQGIAPERFDFLHNEIRSDSVEEIAVEAVNAAFKKLRKPVFVEDTGLFVDALNGFPGTYSAWVTKKIGNPGILKLLSGGKNRKAEFRTCIAFRSSTEVKTFTATCLGKVATEERGSGGFGFDSIFIPHGHDQTFAESIGLKNKLSHRYKSVLLLSEYLLSLKLFH